VACPPAADKSYQHYPLWIPNRGGPFFSPMAASSSRAAPTEDHKPVFQELFAALISVPEELYLLSLCVLHLIGRKIRSKNMQVMQKLPETFFMFPSLPTRPFHF